MTETVWLGKRIYERRVVYEQVFGSKEAAKQKLAEKQGGRNSDDFEWVGQNYPEDDNEIVSDELELNEKLVVEKKQVKD